MEVRDMQANYPDMWNLYLLGLNQLYTTSQEDPFSYYGLASKSTARGTARELICRAQAFMASLIRQLSTHQGSAIRSALPAIVPIVWHSSSDGIVST